MHKDIRDKIFCYVYIDDILIASPDYDHFFNLKLIFEKLQQYEIVNILKKMLICKNFRAVSRSRYFKTPLEKSQGNSII